uniref:Sodium/calcium exchanger membrane region domain-containing protein n=1 Tax=Plectus sambesii TaxID=2011161 RepID=A0A914UTY7_9BILA
MRDICFYLFSVLFSAFVFLYSDFLYLWETIEGAAAVAHSLPISTVAGQLNGHPDIINALTRDDTANEEPEWNFEPILASGYFSSIANGGPAGHDRHEDDITKLPPRTQFTAVFEDLLTAVFPIDEDEWQGNFVERIFAIIKAPLILILKLTNPQAGNHWSKALAVIHCFTCPLFAVAAAQQLGLALFDSVPQLQLWMLSLIVSIIPAILVLVFTSFDQEPRFFKPFSSFAGFLMAVFWIHSLANEVVGVLQMVGVVSGLSHEVLGLTLLAWSNSLGDLVADIAVARRGFPKMGISAAFGGPLFNLLLGVGLPFTIAVMRHGGPIPIIFSNVSKVLVAFL